MRGVQFLTDYQGKKIADLVDINEHSAFWEDVNAEYSEITFQFLTDRDGGKIAVVIDWENHDELWEDIYDILAIEALENEESIPFKFVQNQLEKAG